MCLASRRIFKLQVAIFPREHYFLITLTSQGNCNGNCDYSNSLIMRTDGNPSLRELENAPQPKLQIFFQITRHPRKGHPPVELDFIVE